MCSLPIIHQFTLVTEYALTNELSLSAGYHGQVGHHLADYRNGNQLTAAQAQDLTGGRMRRSVVPAADQTPYFTLVGECGSILVTESQARMTYNAGQLTLRQRTHHGLEYTLNYTYAKSLTNSSGNYAVSNTSFNGLSVQNGYDLNADYGPSGDGYSPQPEFRRCLRPSLRPWPDLWEQREPVHGRGAGRLEVRYFCHPVFGIPGHHFWSRQQQYQQRWVGLQPGQSVPTDDYQRTEHPELVGH